MEGQLALAMFVAVCAILLLGFPVALTLGGTALGFAALGILIGHFDPDYLTALTGRIFGTMGNETLVAVPLFILMGVVLERAKISEDLLANMAGLFGERPGGLGVAVIVVGALLAASTGIVGATVVTMGVLALPSPRTGSDMLCQGKTTAPSREVEAGWAVSWGLREKHPRRSDFCASPREASPAGLNAVNHHLLV